ncbi:RidA family protein [Donghicola tyrosinivorans]|uniref:Enamine deaminase RidA (YjgF/YER057c/UK114 family) n=1 Tax=Donghicola tyrosinivorans TaxID=1652492 RepID=A0A2T0W7J2_9RHOB|nr:RidA family protein [Donghicola tyrosinivorans]PRY82668.1 enamine deaminase RidA (YjgF/YER057c/UK114 family) [Donghicola tyrosinivorans]
MTLSRLNPGPRMSEAVTIADAVFLAGQIPTTLTGDITVQTREVLTEIDAVMAELGGSKADIASVQVWLTDMADFQGMNAVWDEWVDKENPPARATCGVALARPGMRVEMVAVARNPNA